MWTGGYAPSLYIETRSSISEWDQEAGPQRITFGIEFLYRWACRKLGNPPPDSFRGSAAASSSGIHKHGSPITRRSLSPRFGGQRGCFECFIRDNDPRVRYEGQWNLNTVKFSTTHSTTTSGSKASLTFNGTLFSSERPKLALSANLRYRNYSFRNSSYE